MPACSGESSAYFGRCFLGFVLGEKSSYPGSLRVACKIHPLLRTMQLRDSRVRVFSEVERLRGQTVVSCMVVSDGLVFVGVLGCLHTPNQLIGLFHALDAHVATTRSCCGCLRQHSPPIPRHPVVALAEVPLPLLYQQRFNSCAGVTGCARMPPLHDSSYSCFFLPTLLCGLSVKRIPRCDVCTSTRPAVADYTRGMRMLSGAFPAKLKAIRILHLNRAISIALSIAMPLLSAKMRSR